MGGSRRREAAAARSAAAENEIRRRTDALRATSKAGSTKRNRGCGDATTPPSTASPRRADVRGSRRSSRESTERRGPPQALAYGALALEGSVVALARDDWLENDTFFWAVLTGGLHAFAFSRLSGREPNAAAPSLRRTFSWRGVVLNIRVRGAGSRAGGSTARRAPTGPRPRPKTPTRPPWSASSGGGRAPRRRTRGASARSADASRTRRTI